ncbi:hypothetical protein ACOAKC_01150 [Hathewaya histolytica]|uniref:hypothetical protein n=1 Tax=Hathewaya histolytica TaxID=1498 RepID=UPI003B670ABF
MAHTQQERYSNLVDAKLRKTLVTKDNLIFNTRYEGDPKSGAVKIPVRDTEVKVKDYDKANGIKGEQGSTTYLTVTIDKDKAVNEIIDGFDAASVPDGIVAERLDSAGYSVALTIDKDAIEVLENQGTGSSDTTALTEKTAYKGFVEARTKLSNNGVPNDGGRWAIVSPEIYGLLLLDPNFIKQGNLSQELVQEGVIGKIAGFIVFESNNLSEDTEFIVGHNLWAHRVAEWEVPVHLQDLNGSGTYIGASAVQGRKVYTHKVSKPKAIYVKKKSKV